MNRIGGRVLAFACCLAWGAAAPALAENGIEISEPVETPYLRVQITDDSDPWGGVWKQFGYDPNRNMLHGEGLHGRALAPRARSSARGIDVVARIWIDWTEGVYEVAWTRLDAQALWEPLRYAVSDTLPHQEFQVRPGLRQAATAP